MVSSRTHRDTRARSASLFDLSRGVLECTRTTATRRRETGWYFTKAVVTAFGASSVDGSSAHRAPRSPGGLELGGRPQAAQAREARHQGHDQNDADDDHFPGLRPLLALFVARVGGPGDGVGALDEARESRTKRIGRAEWRQRLCVFDGRQPVSSTRPSRAYLVASVTRSVARLARTRLALAALVPVPILLAEPSRALASPSLARGEEGAPFPFAPSLSRGWRSLSNV